jgi:hypothetical protein
MRPDGRILFAVPLLAFVVGATVYASEPARARQPDPVVAATGANGSVAPSEQPITPRIRGTWNSTALPTAKVPCPKGKHQRDVETYLAQLGGFGPIVVDGRQTAAECKTIKKFQLRYAIYPATGNAGETTRNVARRLASTDTGKCKYGTGLTFCVDLTNQTVWIMRGDKVIWKPTVTRTGMAGGFQTPAGTYQVLNRNIREWSDPYEVWMPYWQRFNGGMGFHETTTYLHNSFGSHGCINMLHVDAKKMWELGSVGTRVYIFGRRPGT